jgi:hypothetical protein
MANPIILLSMYVHVTFEVVSREVFSGKTVIVSFFAQKNLYP